MPALFAVKKVTLGFFCGANCDLGQKLHGHKYLINDVLKKELGFDGIVVSDWAGINELDKDYKTCIIQSINAGIDKEKTATTINQVCGSGLRSVASGLQSILSGNSKILVAGGQESMSNAPFYININNEDQNILITWSEPGSFVLYDVTCDGGSWQSEVSWTISDADGNELL